jgi:multicomponent Na+:H+ antiporter subunit B
MTDYLRSIILPLSVMMAFYIQVHGEISPGGGFQAGAILASIYIFYYSLMNEQDENYILLIERLFKISCCGFLIYLAVGIYTAILGGYFLEYNFITGNILGQKIGIFFVEIGVGITVFSVLLMIFLILEVKLYKIMRL